MPPTHSTAGTTSWARPASPCRSRVRAPPGAESWKRAKLKPASARSRWAPPSRPTRSTWLATMSRIASARSATAVSRYVVRRAAVGGRRGAGRPVGVRLDVGGRREALELADPAHVPPGGQPVREVVGEPGRELDVGQRVAAERDERVGVGGVGAAEDADDVGADRAGVAVGRGRRALVPLDLPLDLHGELAEGGVVGLAAARERHLRHDGDPHRVRGYAAPVGDEGARGGAAASARDEGVDGAARRDHPGVPVDVGAQALLDGVEVDAQAEDLAPPVASSHHGEEAVALAGEVAGAQLGRHAGEGEVGGLLGVAEHHVGAGVDELPDAGPVVDGLVEVQVPAGDRDADAVGVVLGEVRRQPRHPGRGLGGAVHHHEVPPAAATGAAPAAHVLGREPAAGLGDPSQRRQVAVLEAAGGQQVEGVRHAGEAGHAGARERGPRSMRRRRSGRSARRSRRPRGGSAARTGRSSSAAAGW